jgi:hypothetical protein
MSCRLQSINLMYKMNYLMNNKFITIAYKIKRLAALGHLLVRVRETIEFSN